MISLLAWAMLAAHPDLDVKVLLPGTEGPRLVLVHAKRGAHAQIDQSQEVLLIRLGGDVSVNGERPRATYGEAGRCEPAVELDFGTELLLLQPSAGREEAVGPP